MYLPFIKVTELESSPENRFVLGMKQVPTHIIGLCMIVMSLIVYLLYWSNPSFLMVIITVLKFVQSPIQTNLGFTIKQYRLIYLE